MKEESGSSPLMVTSAEAARMLLETRHARFIAPFLGRERLVAEVAREISAPLSTTYRYVTRFLEVGILRVTREQKRGGRALKVYRTVADAFFVPNRFRTEPQAWPDAFERAARRGLEHVYGERFPAWGELIFRNEDGVYSTSLARAPGVPVTSLEPDAPAVLTTAHDAVYLDFAEAKNLQRELRALFDAYAAKGGAQRYLLKVGLVPLPADVELIA